MTLTFDLKGHPLTSKVIVNFDLNILKNPVWALLDLREGFYGYLPLFMGPGS